MVSLYFLMILELAISPPPGGGEERKEGREERNLVVFTLGKPGDILINICINWFGEN